MRHNPKKCFFRPFRDLLELVSLKNPALKRWAILDAKTTLPEDIVGRLFSRRINRSGA
jgi:hypothetical protein